ncbi:biotin--[acetyl-CoA-carboxylase] ligase [Azospirillum halopraeferens]|uniref:biotin--[acetyl-CoA-carboxylase] ligase n=1 Tax=Azospirillum halopraeferens TaxID=34010 RepID=UPI00041AE097|nr:biotin--[acetyl-CoA-carboxylase] ligase [Azospirillum halopraeferens]
MIDAPVPGAAAWQPPPGFRVVAYDTVGSTNDIAKDLARSGSPERTVVWARRQTAGRGRRGRAWESAAGNLYLSTVLRPAVPVTVAAQISFVAALAIADLAATLLPASAAVRCKWPNDVLVNGRKLAGILLETEAAADGTVAWLVLGTGINLTEAPPGAEYPATTLAAAGADHPVPETAGPMFLGALDGWLERWTAAGFAAVRTAWLERAAGVGGPVAVRLADRTLHGTFVDLDDDGVLLLDCGDGAGVRRVAAGDVFFPGVPPATGGV